MPVKFRFDKLTITDFRGIHELEVALPDDFPLHLIGSNNAGKSTILEAVAFALRGGGFHQYDLVPFDFFRAAGGEPAREFEICLTLKAEKEAMLPAVQGVGQPIFVHGIRAKGRTLRSGRMEKHFNLLDAKGQTISFSTRTPLQGTTKAELADHSGVGWTQSSARHDHIRDDLPEVMLLTPQNISQSLFQWKTGRPTQSARDDASGTVFGGEMDIRVRRKASKDARRRREGSCLPKCSGRNIPFLEG
jgi:putative ATP-dependent endonuclease of the OLD family